MDNNYKKAMEELVYMASDSLERLANGGRDEDRKAFLNRICYMHRTLQQRLIGQIIIPLVREMAGRIATNNYDARNKLACEACAAMINGLAEKFPYIANGESSLPLI